ncbi:MULTISPECIES: hypothetical protein [unclassified Nocardiopsis]|uniref:hypothetical protein n=1 Tax=Nocardiopsis TaxID=2013 RepID=UPI00387B33D4
MRDRLRLIFVDGWIYGLTLVVGVLMIVQGYGSGITELVWGVSWGPLAALAERVDLPDGSPLLLGTTGCIVVLAACFAIAHD